MAHAPKLDDLPDDVDSQTFNGIIAEIVKIDAAAGYALAEQRAQRLVLLRRADPQGTKPSGRTPLPVRKDDESCAVPDAQVLSPPGEEPPATTGEESPYARSARERAERRLREKSGIQTD